MCTSQTVIVPSLEMIALKYRVTQGMSFSYLRPKITFALYRHEVLTGIPFFNLRHDHFSVCFLSIIKDFYLVSQKYDFPINFSQVNPMPDYKGELFLYIELAYQLPI